MSCSGESLRYSLSDHKTYPIVFVYFIWSHFSTIIFCYSLALCDSFSSKTAGNSGQMSLLKFFVHMPQKTLLLHITLIQMVWTRGLPPGLLTRLSRVCRTTSAIMNLANHTISSQKFLPPQYCWLSFCQLYRQSQHCHQTPFYPYSPVRPPSGPLRLSLAFTSPGIMSTLRSWPFMRHKRNVTISHTIWSTFRRYLLY